PSLYRRLACICRRPGGVRPVLSVILTGYPELRVSSRARTKYATSPHAWSAPLPRRRLSEQRRHIPARVERAPAAQLADHDHATSPPACSTPHALAPRPESALPHPSPHGCRRG